MDGKKIAITREVDGGLETVAASLPAVVTTDLRLEACSLILSLILSVD